MAESRLTNPSQPKKWGRVLRRKHQEGCKNFFAPTSPSPGHWKKLSKKQEPGVFERRREDPKSGYGKNSLLVETAQRFIPSQRYRSQAGSLSRCSVFVSGAERPEVIMCRAGIPTLSRPLRPRAGPNSNIQRPLTSIRTATRGTQLGGTHLIRQFKLFAGRPGVGRIKFQAFSKASRPQAYDPL